MRSRSRITAALVGLIALVLVGWIIGNQLDVSGPAQTSPAPSAEAGLPVRALSELPPEAEQTWRSIQRGGPFAFPRDDGQVFQNREQLLPTKESGYYREYTVRTPGSGDRGPRRLVTGGGGQLYYTDDHYASFVVVDPAR